MKRILIFLMAAVLLLSMTGLTGCSDDGNESDEYTDEEEAGTGQNSAGQGAGSQNSAAADESGKSSKGLFMQVDKATGRMLIRRPEQETSSSMGEKGSWTIFVYMCGSDLESRLFVGGNATDDLKEMRAATSNEQIRYVIETGGCSFWHNGDVDEDVNQRFVIENGKLIKVGELPQASMGKSSTLAEFLKWGVQNFAADRMGVVLWDHGGGSIAGVCYDENEDWDALTLRELDAAFLSVYQTMTDKFELSSWTPA